MADTSGSKMAIRNMRDRIQQKENTPTPKKQESTGLLSRNNTSKEAKQEDTFYEDLILRIKKTMGSNND